MPPANLKAGWARYLSYIKLAADDLDTADGKARAGDIGALSDYTLSIGNSHYIAYLGGLVGAATCARH